MKIKYSIALFLCSASAVSAFQNCSGHGFDDGSSATADASSSGGTPYEQYAVGNTFRLTNPTSAMNLTLTFTNANTVDAQITNASYSDSAGDTLLVNASCEYTVTETTTLPTDSNGNTMNVTGYTSALQFTNEINTGTLSAASDSICQQFPANCLYEYITTAAPTELSLICPQTSGTTANWIFSLQPQTN